MNWNLDKDHSSVEFAVRHLGFATVRGLFDDFDVVVTTNDNGVPSSVRAEIAVASIRTGAHDRDAHLRSPDFFDADVHPKVSFVSTGVVPLGDRRYRVEGQLTVRGQTHPASLVTEVSDFTTDPWGNQRLAAHTTGKIDRSQWGLTWNQVLEAGSLLVGEEVRLTIDTQVVAEKSLVAAG